MSSFLAVMKTLEAVHLKLSAFCSVDQTTSSASGFLQSATIMCNSNDARTKGAFLPQNSFCFFLHILLQCQEIRFLLELRSMMIFSSWRLSLFGTIAWLASEILGHTCIIHRFL